VKTSIHKKENGDISFYMKIPCKDPVHCVVASDGLSHKFLIRTKNTKEIEEIRDNINVFLEEMK